VTNRAVFYPQNASYYAQCLVVTPLFLRTTP